MGRSDAQDIALAGEGGVRVFLFPMCQSIARKKKEDPHPTLSLENGRGLLTYAV
jgi:hypothetical protein